MAKMFYTLEETKSALGRNEEGIKQLSREGRLREFRDGPRLMFKADQVDAIKAELSGGGGGDMSLAPADSGLGLAGDTKAGEEISLGGSMGGIPSPGKTGGGSGMLNLGGPGGSMGGGSGSGLLNLGGSGAGSRGGITVFDVDDSQRVDPSAQTAINAGGEQLSMETGSGSGLLDLTRESDDTSLGAVFDDLGPGKAGASGIGRGPSALDVPTPSGSVIDTGRRVAAPVYVEAPDPLGAALGFAAIVPIICLGFGLFVVATAAVGFHPPVLDDLKRSSEGGKLMIYGIGAAAGTLILFVAGYFVANAARK